MDRHARAISDVAEAALQAETRQLAWARIMEILEATVGFDTGYMGTTPGPMASALAAVLGHEEIAFRKSVGRYLSHITRREIGEYLHRARRGAEVFSTQRREIMTAHYSPLSPRIAKHFLCRVSWCRGELIGISVERWRGTSDFGDKDLEFMDAVWPVLQLVNLLNDGSPAHGLGELRGTWRLSEREADLAALVVRGLQNAEIGCLLGLSVNTVRNALVRIFTKAHVSTRAELVFIAHQRPMSSSCATGVDARTEDGVHLFAKRVKALGAGQAAQVLPRSTLYGSRREPVSAAQALPARELRAQGRIQVLTGLPGTRASHG